MSDLLNLVDQYKQALLTNDAKAVGRLARAYHASYKNLQEGIDALIKQIEGGKYTVSQVYKLERYKSLMAQVAQELNDLQKLTSAELSTAAKFGIELGGDHARGLIAATIRDEALKVAFNKLNPEAVKSLLGFLDPNGTLYKRLDELAPFTADRISQDLVNGIVKGYNPEKIARLFTNDWGMALTDSMRMVRTAQLYSYREANRANFVANSDVVEGWYWCAELDSSTCAECIAMDGTFHTNDEVLNDHYNGRCAMVPAVKGFDPPIGEGRGEEWFNKQNEETQREMLGDAKYEAWKDGKFEFSDLSKVVDDPVYGEMRVEASLKDLLGEEALPGEEDLTRFKEYMPEITSYTRAEDMTHPATDAEIRLAQERIKQMPLEIRRLEPVDDITRAARNLKGETIYMKDSVNLATIDNTKYMPNGSAWARNNNINLANEFIGTPIQDHEYIHTLEFRNKTILNTLQTKYKPPFLYLHAEGAQAKLGEQWTMTLSYFDKDKATWAKNIKESCWIIGDMSIEQANSQIDAITEYLKDIGLW